MADGRDKPDLPREDAGEDTLAKVKKILTKAGIEVIDNPSKAVTLLFVGPKGKAALDKIADELPRKDRGKPNPKRKGRNRPKPG